MKDRILSTIGLWTVVAAILWIFSRYDLAQVGGFLTLLGLALGAQYELYRILEQAGGAPRIALGMTCGLALLVAQFLGLVSLDNVEPTALALGSLAWVALLLSLLRNPNETKAWVVRFPTLFGFLYVPMLLAFLAGFVGWKTAGGNTGLWLAVWVIAVTKFTDVGGLLIGVPFGRHKIAPNVSPAKSWEGCVGGVALSCLVGAGGALALTHFANIEFSPAKGALIALPLAILSIPSDLVESHLKRRAGVKDSGKTIPGIGGALDLIDSLLLVAPVAYLLLHSLTHAKVG